MGDDDDNALDAAVEDDTGVPTLEQTIDPTIAERNDASAALLTRLIALATSEKGLDNNIFGQAREIIQQYATVVARLDTHGAVVIGLPMSATSKDISKPLLLITPDQQPNALYEFDRVEHDAMVRLKKSIHTITPIDPALVAAPSVNG